jgi:uncharacterized Ntn-hydrolase superfamily protein
MKLIKREPCISTYSIVGADPAAGEVGIAVQSKFLAVGNVVPWAKGGIGAVATQSWANIKYGVDGLKLLEEGLHPEEVIARLIAEDDGRETRQVGIVDIQGRSATFTGKECSDWAGGIAGENFAAQGNVLVSKETVDALAGTFQSTSGDLTTKLMEALAAGQAAGGDRRGMQSAALYIVKEGAGYGGGSDRLVDIRVDDHPDPIAELRRILGLYRFYLQKTKEGNVSKIEGGAAKLILSVLSKKGLYDGDLNAEWNEKLHDIFLNFSLIENFDERLQPYGYVDNEVLEFMKENY